jgi:hypothetical protein
MAAIVSWGSPVAPWKSCTGFSRRVTGKGSPKFVARIILLLFTLVASGLWGESATVGALPNTYFSIGSARPSPHPTPEAFQALIAHWFYPWPTVPFDTMRLWDTNTFWSVINTGPGQYNWTVLDGWLNAANTHQVELLFTLGMTPQWASSDPNNPICHIGPGQCSAPDDVNPDGSGTDQHWKDFVTAVAQHVGTQVQYWEIWNEPNNLWYWSGTPAQLARMAQDARTIIRGLNPAARMLNAGTGALTEYGLTWWKAYGAAGGLQWADIIAVHGDVRSYPPKCGVYPQAENFLKVMTNLRQVLASYGQGNKPVWDTEASWGKTTDDCFTNQDLQAAFLARFYIMHRSARLHRFYWRAWIDGDGGLYNGQTGINKAGVAYQQIHDWLVGRTLPKSCKAKGSIWSCLFTGSNGYVAEAIWDTSKTCKNGNCGTGLVTVGSQYLDYLTLDGSKIQIQNNTVPVGAKPIWLEN